ncbi:hypothetical protein D3C81_1910560 [compost metagenome]
MPGQLLARQRATQGAGNIGQIDEMAVDGQVPGQLGDQGLGQCQGAGGAEGAAGDGDQIDGIAHDGS